MTTATLAHLPLAAGGAVLTATGHAIHWGFSRYMRAPLANTGILCLVTFSAFAGSNALYMQQGEHPNPMFAPSAHQASSAPQVIEPVVPATRKKPLTLAPLPAETTGSVNADAPLGNAEVSEIQQKLTSMQIFDGKVDGLYGPRTARAIKAFETRMGLPAKGELTREVLEAIRVAPIIVPERPAATATPVVAPRVEPQPQPAAEAAPAVTPLAVVEEPEPRAAFVVVEASQSTRAPLPMPAPLQMAADAPVAAAELPQQPVLRRELPATPQEAMDIAVQTAGEAIDTIVAGVQSVAMTTPGRKPEQVEPVEFVADTSTIEAATLDEPDLQTASIAAPKVGVPLAVEEEPVTMSSENIPELDTEARVEELMAPFSVTDPVMVAKVQRGLGSLGFLHGPADGVAGEATAKAIRNFEVYYNYRVTGRISPELLDLLVQNGASI
jgi:peptidoglycan hydrolase-like protein with peptidoglycan-binding domain